MIAFVAVRRRSVCRLTSIFERWRMMRNWREHGQLQPQLQPIQFRGDSPITADQLHHFRGHHRCEFGHVLASFANL
jgi:hypothetical protein